MLFKTFLRHGLCLSALSLCLVACGEENNDNPQSSTPCDEAACAAEGKTCDYINNVCVECLDLLDCSAPTPVCDLATHTCVQCVENTDCMSGQKCVSNACITPVECSEESDCPNDGVCGEDGKCLTSREEDCADLGEGELPANASQVEAKVQVTWTAEDGWTSPAKCAWQCNPDFVKNEDGTGCVRQAITACEEDSDCENQGCVEGVCASAKQAACDPETDPAKPEDASEAAENAQVTVEWNAETDDWAAPAKCVWTCPQGTTLDESGNRCVAAASPVCGDGRIEGDEACDTGANLTPAAPAFPENSTCATVMGDGKTYEGTLACNADCTAIVTAGCTEVPEPPPPACVANTCNESNDSFCSEGAWETCPSETPVCQVVDGTASCVAAPSGELRPFFSEYIKGSSNNKAIEVYNPGAQLMSCKINVYMNGASTSTNTSAEFDLAPQGVYSICHDLASNDLKARCNTNMNVVTNFNGDDAIELICGDERVDIFGKIGERPNSEWKANDGTLSTKDMTLRRKCSVTAGTTANAEGFPTLATEWDAYPVDTFDGIGTHCPLATTCGNGSLDAGEACDGELLPEEGNACPNEWFTGSKGCSSDCSRIVDNCVAPRITCQTTPQSATLGISQTVVATMNLKVVDGSGKVVTDENYTKDTSLITDMLLTYRPAGDEAPSWMTALSSGTSVYGEDIQHSADNESIAYSYTLTQSALLPDGEYKAVWGFMFNGVQYYCPASTNMVNAVAATSAEEIRSVATLIVDSQYCVSNDDCGGQTCNTETHQCEAAPAVCEPGCGTGENEGQLCVIDEQNPNGVWTNCPNGCENDACNPVTVNCAEQDEYYCLELEAQQGNGNIYCNTETGACVGCLTDSDCNSGEATANECNLTTFTCQSKCGNYKNDQGDEMCDPTTDKSGWLVKTCDDSISGTVGEISCTDTCDIDDSACAAPTTSITWCRLQWPETLTLNAAANTADVYGRFLIPAESVIAPKLIYGTDLADIANWTAVDAAVNSSCGDACGPNTEYSATITAAMYDALAAGTYKYTYKFTENGTDWYCVYADDASATPKTAAEMAAESRVGTMTVEKEASPPRVHTQTFDFIESIATGYTATESTTDENGVTWTYVGRPNLNNSGADYSIDGKGVIIRNNGNKIVVSGFSGITRISFQYNWWGAKTDVVVTTKSDETGEGEALETKETDIRETAGKLTAELNFTSSSDARYLEMVPKNSGNRIVIDNISITE